MNLLETDLQNNSEGKVENYMKFYLKMTPSLQESLYLKENLFGIIREIHTVIVVRLNLIAGLWRVQNCTIFSGPVSP